jgi:hypothetical protein
MRSRIAKLAAGAAGVLALGSVMVPVPTASAEGSRVVVRECVSSDLHASYRATDAALSHRFGRIVLKNVSGHRCKTGGYGGLSYVGDGNGSQIGAPADRTPSTARTIVLQPGQRVWSAVSATIVEVYPRRECRPTHVDGFRIYPPNETHSLFVKHSTRGCRNDNVHLLSHKAYRRP